MFNKFKSYKTLVFTYVEIDFVSRELRKFGLFGKIQVFLVFSSFIRKLQEEVKELLH